MKINLNELKQIIRNEIKKHKLYESVYNIGVRKDLFLKNPGVLKNFLINPTDNIIKEKLAQEIYNIITNQSFMGIGEPTVHIFDKNSIDNPTVDSVTNIHNPRAGHQEGTIENERKKTIEKVLESQEHYAINLGWTTAANQIWREFKYLASLQKKINGITNNFYLPAISKDIKNISNFLNSLSYLIVKLKEYADDNQIPISFKLPAGSVIALISHNDSMKFYFYHNLNTDVGTNSTKFGINNKELSVVIKDLKGIVNSWLNNHNIIHRSRSYESGYDIEKSNTTINHGSFGQLLSRKFVDLLYQQININNWLSRVKQNESIDAITEKVFNDYFINIDGFKGFLTNARESLLKELKNSGYK